GLLPIGGMNNPGKHFPDGERQHRPALGLRAGGATVVLIPRRPPCPQEFSGMLSPLALRARPLDRPGAPAAPRQRAGVLVLSFSGPRFGMPFLWVLLMLLATGATCYLAVALSRDTNFSGAPAAEA